MKKVLLAAVCFIGLSGCEGLNPQTGAELQATAQTSAFHKTSTYQVGRSVFAVAQSWRAGAAKCLNRRTRTTATVGSIGGVPMIENTVTDYESSVQSVGSGAIEITVRMKIPNGMVVGMDGKTGSIIFAATATPTAGGSLINDAMVRGGPFPVPNPIDEGVRAWAEGTSNACPTMPR